MAGEVIYEHVRPGTLTSSYAGLRFPSGDIPVPARQLFLQNPLRFINDVDGIDAVIFGARLPSGEQLDLSMSCLRAVSKVCWWCPCCTLVLWRRDVQSCWCALAAPTAY
jgi:light-regulated signal transduction histidine kinase (bacteriophytochrome)